MQTPYFESTLCILSKLSGHFWADPIYMMVAPYGTYTYKKFHPPLIPEILDFHDFCNLIADLPINTLLILWISIKRHLKLIYHFEVLWACPTAHDQTQLFLLMSIHIKKLTLCFNFFIKYWTFKNLALWLIKNSIDNKTKPNNFVCHGNWNGKSSITIYGFPNSDKGWGNPSVGGWGLGEMLNFVV